MITDVPVCCSVAVCVAVCVAVRSIIAVFVAVTYPQCAGEGDRADLSEIVPIPAQKERYYRGCTLRVRPGLT